MTQAMRPELSPVLRPNGEPRLADAGATYQGAPIAMKKCSACGGFVVFVKSTRTGKWYLADCFRYHGSDAYFYVKASPHFKTCEREQNRRRAEDEAEQAKAEKDRRWDAAYAELGEVGQRWKETHGPGYASQPEYLNEFNAVLIKHGFEWMICPTQEEQ